MTFEEAESILKGAYHFFESQGSGYKSWGEVNVLQIAIRLDESNYLLTKPSASLEKLSATDIAKHTLNEGWIGQLFANRKKVNVILVAQQQYASRVNEDIEAILDDQAQLLGVSVRVAKIETRIPWALKGRFAAILPDKTCACLGATLDDAYVGAQLLEKTAKVFLEAQYIGGAKPINKIEAWFMQQYYLLKYSKEAVKNK